MRQFASSSGRPVSENGTNVTIFYRARTSSAVSLKFVILSGGCRRERSHAVLRVIYRSEFDHARAIDINYAALTTQARRISVIRPPGAATGQRQDG
jgi:hypothetical protein